MGPPKNFNPFNRHDVAGPIPFVRLPARAGYRRAVRL